MSCHVGEFIVGLFNSRLKKKITQKINSPTRPIIKTYSLASCKLYICNLIVPKDNCKQMLKHDKQILVQWTHCVVACIGEGRSSEMFGYKKGGSLENWKFNFTWV